MNYLTKLPENIYPKLTFKHYFIQRWNKVCDKSKNKNPPLGIVFAEAFAILLELINQEQTNEDKIEQEIKDAISK
jgi:hypothetical protein